MENHHHQSEASAEASLRTFRAYSSVSKFEHGRDALFLLSVNDCFNYLFDLNKAFARLVVEIDYPISMWKLPLMDEFLNFTLILLDLLNSVESSISHVCQARLSMALSLSHSSVWPAIEHPRLAKFKTTKINLKVEEVTKEMNFPGNEMVIHQALVEMKKNSELVFGIVLSILSGELETFLDLKKEETNISTKLEDFTTEKSTVLNGIEESNEDKACRRLRGLKMGKNGKIDQDVRKFELNLDEVRKQLDDIGSKADEMFSKVLAGRNEVLDVLRHKNN